MLQQEELKPITLYELEGCPFCQKVIEKLEELGVEYESEMVGRAARPQVKALTGGPTQVPVIEDPNTDEFDWLNESDEIISYLEREYGQ